MSATEIIECPLCGVPHRLGAVTCDGCGQPLHERPDVAALKEEYARRKRDIALSVVAIVAMIALNDAVFGGAGFVISTAPLGWLGWSLIRFRTLKRALARQPGPPPA
jgi:hypothetical protein